MNGMFPAFYPKRLPVYLVVATIAISLNTGTSEAMFMPAVPQTRSAPLVDRAANLAKIQEAQTVAEKANVNSKDLSLSSTLRYGKAKVRE
jgi:hypothetical protein